MRIQIKKSGNSAILRIPHDVLKELQLSIGENLEMNVTEKGLVFEKLEHPRKGWFDNVCPVEAKQEADLMESEFSETQQDNLDDWDLDEWKDGEEW